VSVRRATIEIVYAVNFLTSVLLVHLGQNFGYLDWGFWCCSSLPARKCRNITRNKTQQFPSDSHFTYSPINRR